MRLRNGEERNIDQFVDDMYKIYCEEWKRKNLGFEQIANTYLMKWGEDMAKNGGVFPDEVVTSIEEYVENNGYWNGYSEEPIFIPPKNAFLAAEFLDASVIENYFARMYDKEKADIFRNLYFLTSGEKDISGLFFCELPEGTPTAKLQIDSSELTDFIPDNFTPEADPQKPIDTQVSTGIFYEAQARTGVFDKDAELVLKITPTLFGDKENEVKLFLQDSSGKLHEVHLNESERESIMLFAEDQLNAALGISMHDIAAENTRRIQENAVAKAEAAAAGKEML